ncbi:MAG: tRNA dihydrouridine synthase DusB [Holosporales bacterium]|jgi:tRNA-dihydrouridine synthase B|nr:tRNA dihydrouridine synthase DusB [Holosporales bacterium]
MNNQITFGGTVLPSNVLLAPMAGVTDLPFRKIVREFGDFLVFSEMIASNAVIRHVARTYQMIEGSEDKYTSIQIVGSDPNIMAEAAKLSQNLGAHFIDINMGCPVRKIIRCEAGSALMKNELLAKEIFEKVVRAVTIPVSLKIRLGWDKEHQNAPEIAKIAENSGISMITVHGRTRSELYSGKPNWKAIRNVKNAVKNIPIIANGNIIDLETANICIRESGADGVMIGRGSLGSPWILREIHDNFQEKSQKIISLNKLEIAKRHISYIMDFYGENRAIFICRKVLMYYSKGVPDASLFRKLITEVSTEAEIYNILRAMFEE